MNTLFLQSYEYTFVVLEIIQTIAVWGCLIVLAFCALTFFLEPFMAMIKAKKESHTKKFEQQTVERQNKTDSQIAELNRIVEPLKNDPKR